ncbi:hypothetical protein EGR_07643 [Echinococcus granulosus]|uniref:Uncharacterized protein n=1 Tax=Echinococcus granulosus TaxID=6210 RepID=W6U8E2_ECHGR|nr:hypothetical protein EGR_07643 [Echinococcus granulosus]EUB57478.1 hypothetical protein EGR_07643 [Echinococcus granulosus]
MVSRRQDLKEINYLIYCLTSPLKLQAFERLFKYKRYVDIWEQHRHANGLVSYWSVKFRQTGSMGLEEEMLLPHGRDEQRCIE